MLGGFIQERKITIMSSFFKRSNGIYYYQWYEKGKQHKYSLMTDDKVVAKQRADELDKKLSKNSMSFNAKEITVSDCINKFLENKQATVKTTTFNRYVTMSKNLKDWFGNTPANKLTTEKIAEYINYRRKCVAGKTIHEELNIIRSSLKTAWANYMISELPVREWPKVKKIPAKPETLGYYSLQDIAKLKNYFKGKKFEPVFLFALYTGCRRSEIANIKAEDIDLSMKTIRIRNIKTESDSRDVFRYISINSHLKQVLQKELNKVKTGLLFPWFASIAASRSAKIMKKACDDSGVSYKRFHGLRHTMATYLIASGMNIREVMGVMGWTELSTAEKYIHLANAMKTRMNIVPF